MSRSPRLRLALLLLAALLPLRAASAQSERPGVQVLSADEIARSGAARLTDLFDLLDGWHAYSVDAYTWQASSGGLAPAGTPGWTLLVDGVPIDLALFEGVALNLLPIDVTRLDSVVAVGMPDVQAGRIAPAGVLHLFTRRPPRGASVDAGLSAGNEVNDPGPFRYTEHPAPNVDRSGPLFHGQAAGRVGGWHARALVTLDEFHATDERILARVRHLYADETPPRLLLAGAGLQLGVDRPGGRHRLLAGLSRLHDLPFWEPYGAEIPTTRRVAFAGAAGETGGAGGPGLAYRAAFVRYDLAPRPNRDTLHLDFAQERLDASVEARLGSGRLTGALGAGAAYYQIHTSDPVRDPSLVVTRAFAHAAWTPGRLRQELAVQLQHTYDRLGVRALARTHVRPSRRHLFTLDVSLLRRSLEEENRLWYWTAIGYDLPGRAGVDFTGLPYLPLGTTVTADAGWRASLPHAITVAATAFARRFFDQTFADYRFDVDSTTSRLAAATRLVPGVDGRLFGGSAEVRYTGLARVEQRLHYRYTRPLWSNPTFAAAWGSQPWHQAAYTVRYVPVPRFSLFGRLRYTAPTRWPAFAAAARSSAGRVPDRLPAYWLLDVTAYKRFWGEHLSASATLHNLLNQPHRTHPAGVVTALQLTFRLQLHLGVGGPPEPEE